jgi:ATP-dependent DNA ligase
LSILVFPWRPCDSLTWLARAGRPSKLGTVPPPPLAQRIALGLMHATQVAAPFHRPGWVYEEKVDGWRMVATKAAGVVRLVSRNGRDHTHRFPELVKARSTD